VVTEVDRVMPSERRGAWLYTVSWQPLYKAVIAGRHYAKARLKSSRRTKWRLAAQSMQTRSMGGERPPWGRVILYRVSTTTALVVTREKSQV